MEASTLLQHKIVGEDTEQKEIVWTSSSESERRLISQSPRAMSLGMLDDNCPSRDHIAVCVLVSDVWSRF